MMPVFIGGETFVNGDKLLAIVDFQYFHDGPNKEYFAKLQEQQKVMDITDGSEPRALVITEDGAYITNILPLTLKRRADKLREEIVLS